MVLVAYIYKKHLYCSMAANSRLKNKFITLIACLVLGGCTVHRFQKSEKYDGQTVARFGYIIPEYTTDFENKAPPGPRSGQEQV